MVMNMNNKKFVSTIVAIGLITIVIFVANPVSA